MRLLVISTVSLWVGLLSTAASDWPGSPYVEVRAFAYNKAEYPVLPIRENGHLNRTVLNKQGVVLTAEQIKRLLAAATGKRPAPEWMAMCFNPRHAFVFYDAAKRPVTWVELCFECSGAPAEPFREGQVYDVGAPETLAAQLKLPLIPK